MFDDLCKGNINRIRLVLGLGKFHPSKSKRWMELLIFMVFPGEVWDWLACGSRSLVGCFQIKAPLKRERDWLACGSPFPGGDAFKQKAPLTRLIL